MTRTITPAEIKPGMTIRFDLEGWDVKGTVARMHRRPQGMWLYTDQSFELSLDLDAPVTVLSEPQPAEPTAFGARVVAGGYEFLLSHGGRRSWKARLDGKRYAWTDLCEMGSVAVIDATPSWTVPETPEVPERIEEWDTWDDVPEGVVVTVPGLFCHYRKNQGAIEFSDPDDDPEWTEPGVRAMPRGYGPWTRATDA